MPRQLTLPRPDDWHLHLRDGDGLARTVPDTARTFGRALVMPNLVPPVTTTEQALAYRARILEAAPAGARFEPWMTLYLTDRTRPDEIARAKASGAVLACKLYPAGATTNSDAGVTDLGGLDDTLAAMAEQGVVLCVHGEVTAHDVDIFARERVFLDEVLAPLVDRHPTLRVVLEHITTADGVDFVAARGANVAGTITAHHLLLNRNDLLAGGLRPHHYCLPVLKSERHRQALVAAATSGDPSFFAGTDSAPHTREKKEHACGCAGCYTAPHALALYAEAFEAAGALEGLADFVSRFGARFYELKQSAETVTLVEERVAIPDTLPFGDAAVVPLRAGGEVAWRVEA